MSSAISCIVIKSDPILRRVPKLGQTVGVAGTRGLFVVMNLDHRSQMVQLMERSGKHRLVEVPFDSVRTVNRKLVEALHRFLHLKEDADKHES